MISDFLEQRLMDPLLNNKVLNNKHEVKNEAKVQLEIMNDYLNKGDSNGFLISRERYLKLKVEEIKSELNKKNHKNAYNIAHSLTGFIADDENPDDVIIKALGTYTSGKTHKHVDVEMDSNRTIPLENMIVNIDDVDELHGKAKTVVDEANKFYRNKAKYPDMPGYDENAQHILLTGEPGTGKTTIAKVLAYNMDADLIVLDTAGVRSSGYGESAARMKSIFEQVVLHCNETGKPTILFIDEVDQIARARGSDTHEATQSILSELLVYMDGIQGMKSGLDIMMLFATNCENTIDPAFKSRTEIINVPVPDFTTRTNIVKSILNKSPNRISLNESDVEEAIKYTEPQNCLKDRVNYCFTGRDLKRAVKTASDFAVARFEDYGVGDGPKVHAVDLIKALKQEIESLSVVYTAPLATRGIL